MKIVLDILGGDNPAVELIKGGVQAAKSYDVEIVLSGDRETIEKSLGRHPPRGLSIIDAPDVITMEDSPAEAVRKKKESSLVKGISALKEGMADAFVSPGNTGAVMAASLLKLGRLPGVKRPGIAIVIPTINDGRMTIIDVGANVDCFPENLKQFAIMGAIYTQEIVGIEKPRIGLLNIGTEEGKGNELTRKALPLLEELDDFVGNVESNQLFQGEVDVLVCDGFVGNVLLKALEGGVSATIDLLKRAIQRNLQAKLGALILRPALRRFGEEMSFSYYGGAPLLGVRGVVIIAHGHSGAKAIKNAIGVAKNSVENALITKIEKGISRNPAGVDTPILRS